MDKIFEIIGLEGPYQNILLIINLFTGVLPIIYTFQIPFLTKHPSFFVQKLQSDDPNKIYELDYNSDLCDSSLYNITKNPDKSLINWSYTYDFYCEKETYITVITSIVFVGIMIGTITIVPLFDKVGRSIIMKTCVIISLILYLNQLFCIGPNHLVLINLIAGINYPFFLVAYALFTEFFPQEKNGFLIGIFNAIYPLAGILYCFFFMISYSWRLLYLITTLIHIYYTYITLKYFLESPRWLHSVGNKEKCLDILNQLAIINGRQEQWIEFKNNNTDLINKIGTPFLEGKGNNNEEARLQTNYNIIQILRFRSQRIIFIKLTIVSICAMYNYYGIVLNLAKMKGNFYLNSIFAFLGEIISELITGKLADKYGRIFIVLWSCAIGLIGYILYLISPSFKFIFVFIAMIGFAGVFNVISIYTPEIYPTKIRNITSSYTSFISRLSPISIPILTQTFPELIDYTFIFSGIIDALIGMTLEETLGKKLLDIIPEEEEENENLRKNFLNGI